MQEVAAKTSLYDEHIKAGGKIVPFAGFLLPVQYKEGVIKEHLAVRQSAGVFDVSHMGEAFLQGADALKNLNYIMTNSFDDMQNGSCRYTLMLYPNAGQVDDLIVYKINDEKYLLVLNASNTQKDIAWIKEHLSGDCTLTNASETTAQIALQGPNAKDIMQKVSTGELPQKNYTFSENIMINGANCLVSCTGYTGEHGYEIYLPPESASDVWRALLNEGAMPCGLGARDTLRLEASMPLYGHELSESIHATFTGLNFAIKMQKSDFIGKSAIENFSGDKYIRVGLKAIDKGIVRENQELYINDEKVGYTTSGTHCPYLGGAFAMAYIKAEKVNPEDELYALVRERKIKMELIKLPFYKRQK